MAHAAFYDAHRPLTTVTRRAGWNRQGKELELGGLPTTVDLAGRMRLGDCCSEELGKVP